MSASSANAVLGKALYDFTGDASLRQLSFKKDDVIRVTNQYENGWWAGELNGKIGYLPSTYVKLEGAPAGPRTGPPPTTMRTGAPTGGGGGGGLPQQGGATLQRAGQAPNAPAGGPPQRAQPPPPGGGTARPTKAGAPTPPARNPGGGGSPSGQTMQRHGTIGGSSGIGQTAGGAVQSLTLRRSDVSEGDLADLDRLVRSLQAEVLDLKKLM